MNRDRADPCPPGYYCPAKTGADLQLCPSGTYNPILGLYEESQCVQCDGGSYCKDPGQSAITGNCSAGYYCQVGVNMAEPTGNHTGVGGICPSGYFCPTGSVIPQGCPAGYYTELDNQPECTECPEGYYCLENATTYLDTICPAGKECFATFLDTIVFSIEDHNHC